MPRRILLTGGTGMVGRNVLERLRDAGLAVKAPSRAELDLTDAAKTTAFFSSFRPDVVINAAGRVGGIQANIRYPVDFLIENIGINRNVLMAAHAVDAPMVINLASSCVYSRDSECLLTEDSILTGELEPTNEGYALAKIFALRLGQYINRQYCTNSFKTLVPCNLFGRYDHFDGERSHMVPAVIHKIHCAKLRGDAAVTIWGDGLARREFMYVDDLADIIIAVMENFETLPDVMNVGLGHDLSVKEYYELIAAVIGWDGEFLFDTSKPVGMRRKVVDITRQREWGMGTADVAAGWNYSNLQLLSFGDRAVTALYPLATTSWDGSEYAAIDRVVKGGMFTMGPEVATFEKMFAEWQGSRFAVMVNSGSSANLIMTAALFFRKDPSHSLKPGDEVIVPAVSWPTTYYPLSQYGLKQKFVDIDLNTLNYDLAALRSAVTDHTRAIMAVNLLGNPNDFGEIDAIIGDRNIILIEDNCESMGAEYQGQHAGSFGVMGSFSTFFSHHISTMEGGVVVTDDEELYHILLSLRAHGWTRNLPTENLLTGVKSSDPFEESFRFVLPGYNVRPLELSGAIGIEQVKKLPALIAARRENAKFFVEVMKDHPKLRIQQEIGNSSWFGFSLVIREGVDLDRKQLVKRLIDAGFESRPIVTGNFARSAVIKHMDTEISGCLPNADRIDTHGVFVGNHHYSIKDAINTLARI